MPDDDSTRERTVFAEALRVGDVVVAGVSRQGSVLAVEMHPDSGRVGLVLDTAPRVELEPGDTVTILDSS